MEDDVNKLEALLDEAISILRGHGVSHWADWLIKDVNLIRNDDFYGVEHLLTAFGGMGSLNDLGLAEPSKDDPTVLVTSTDDARFQAVLSSIYSLAKDLTRSRSSQR